jgi:transposase
VASLATDGFGVSGQLTLEALVKEKATPQEMAELTKRRLREKIPELGPALQGKLDEHHRFLSKLQLASGTFRLHRDAGAESRMA